MVAAALDDPAALVAHAHALDDVRLAYRRELGEA